MSDQPQEGQSRTVTYDDFTRLDIRIGTIVSAEPFPEARAPAFKLIVDFGPLGMRRSSAQITKHYRATELVGRQVACVVNFPVKRIAGFPSEILILGGVPEAGDVVLLHPERPVPNGTIVA
ncbi:MAG TPA: tRNA-binding protein [Gemmatimonadaceae bacterium]